MPTPAKFWDRIAKYYAKRPVADQASYEKKLDITRGYLRPGMEVLEIGCGTGSTALAHAPFVKHIHATDLSSKMIGIARARTDAAGAGNITFEQVALADLAVPDAGLDVVLALSLLHLVDDRDAAIVRIFEMLKPGGAFVSSTTCLGETMGWFRPVAFVGHALGLLPRINFFGIDDLEDSVRRAGFGIDHRWHPGADKAVFLVALRPA